MTAALAGIVINAIGLQRERHPAPLFAPEAVAPPVSAAPQPTPAPATVASAPKTEPAAPAVVKPSLPAPPASIRKTDPIGDWLRTATAPDTTKNVLAAQRALIKLGYDLQADGVMGASTVEALHDFEKSHGLPATSELSPRLIAKLNGAGR
jgi:peptidoglycan hydrolase-like protein with peptidoglycan-binding domain